MLSTQRSGIDGGLNRREWWQTINYNVTTLVQYLSR